MVEMKMRAKEKGIKYWRLRTKIGGNEKLEWHPVLM